MLAGQARLFPPELTKRDKFSVSPLRESDHEELSQLAKQTYAETYPEYFSPDALDQLFGETYLKTELPRQLNDGRYFYLVAKSGDEMIGYAKLIYNSDSVFLDKLYFLKRYHNKGFGTQLLQACYQHATDRNYSTLYLHVWDKNQAAIGFYSKHGLRSRQVKIPYLYADGTPSDAMDDVMICDDIKGQLDKKKEGCGLGLSFP